jgi:hypothetical protein
MTEGVAHHLVGHHPLVPGVGEADQTLGAARGFVNRLHLLARSGIDSIVVDNRSRLEIEQTVRAGILERTACGSSSMQTRPIACCARVTGTPASTSLSGAAAHGRFRSTGRRRPVAEHLSPTDSRERAPAVPARVPVRLVRHPVRGTQECARTDLQLLRSRLCADQQRTETMQRMYLQCDPDEPIDSWSDDHSWTELQGRVGATDTPCKKDPPPSDRPIPPGLHGAGAGAGVEGPALLVLDDDDAASPAGGPPLSMYAASRPNWPRSWSRRRPRPTSRRGTPAGPGGPSLLRAGCRHTARSPWPAFPRERSRAEAAVLLRLPADVTRRAGVPDLDQQ